MSHSVLSALTGFINPDLIALYPTVNRTIPAMIEISMRKIQGVVYFLRFSRKVRRTTIDFLKLACIALLIIYPITFCTIFPLESAWKILRSLTLPFVAVIYIYDRWILKKENMKRKFVIALVAQTLLILVFFTSSLIYKAEADKQRELTNLT